MPTPQGSESIVGKWKCVLDSENQGDYFSFPVNFYEDGTVNFGGDLAKWTQKGNHVSWETKEVVYLGTIVNSMNIRGIQCSSDRTVWGIWFAMRDYS